MRKCFLWLCFAAVGLMAFSAVASAQKSRKSVSVAEVNGEYRMNFRGKFRKFTNDIKLLALGKGKVRVAMDLLYPIALPDGENTVNMGSLDGEANIKGDVATYHSDEFGPCTITIKFVRPGTIKVTQVGTDADCGFGHNVFAGGTYRKVSSRKPKFDPTEH
jgi:hypothetical protein